MFFVLLSRVFYFKSWFWRTEKEKLLRQIICVTSCKHWPCPKNYVTKERLSERVRSKERDERQAGKWNTNACCFRNSFSVSVDSRRRVLNIIIIPLIGSLLACLLTNNKRIALLLFLCSEFIKENQLRNLSRVVFACSQRQ